MWFVGVNTAVVPLNFHRNVGALRLVFAHLAANLESPARVMTALETIATRYLTQTFFLVV